MKRSSNPEEEIFAAALTLPASERDGYLQRACADDLGLHARVPVGDRFTRRTIAAALTGPARPLRASA
jgi:hypothetical protein